MMSPPLAVPPKPALGVLRRQDSGRQLLNEDCSTMVLATKRWAKGLYVLVELNVAHAQPAVVTGRSYWLQS